MVIPDISLWMSWEMINTDSNHHISSNFNCTFGYAYVSLYYKLYTWCTKMNPRVVDLVLKGKWIYVLHDKVITEVLLKISEF